MILKGNQRANGADLAVHLMNAFDNERVHVAQYEQLGPLFFVAYAGSSLLAWCRGGCPYRDNRFERQAFAMADDSESS